MGSVYTGPVYTVMEIIDKNQDCIPQGDYLTLCNKLKEVYQDQCKQDQCKQDQNKQKGKWDEIMGIYAEWKEAVRAATAAETKMNHVVTMYKAYMEQRIQVEPFYKMCVEYYYQKHGIQSYVTEPRAYIMDMLDKFYEEMRDYYYEQAFRTHKYEADNHWEAMTKCEEFEEFLDLLSPVELYMHRELCEKQGETLSSVYRQKPKTVNHEKKEYQWFSHERLYPEMDYSLMDEEEDDYDY